MPPPKKPDDRAPVLKAHSESDSASPARRGRGRPPRLSREAIVETALELLATHAPDEMTLTEIGERLGTATMSLYNYFPNLDAVLIAAADRAFALFTPPRICSGQPWQEALLDWMWALQEHFARYPVMLRGISPDGQLATAWLKLAAPLVRSLRCAGFEGKGLAFASNWVITETLGMIMMELYVPSFSRPVALNYLAGLNDDDQAIFLELRSLEEGFDSQQVLDFSFQQVIAGLEQMLMHPVLPGAKPRRGPAHPR